MFVKCRTKTALCGICKIQLLDCCKTVNWILACCHPRSSIKFRTSFAGIHWAKFTRLAVHWHSNASLWVVTKSLDCIHRVLKEKKWMYHRESCSSLLSVTVEADRGLWTRKIVLSFSFYSLGIVIEHGLFWHGALGFSNFTCMPHWPCVFCGNVRPWKNSVMPHFQMLRCCVTYYLLM